MTTNIFRLQIIDHWCFNPDSCSDVVVERAGTSGKVRKLVLSSEDGRRSRFIPTIEAALAWASAKGFTIPEEDVEKCRLLIS
jgi:hypothetical protein